MYEVISSYLFENRWAVLYGLTVLFLVCLANKHRDDRQKSVCASLFFLWLINIFHTELTHQMTPVMFFATGDFFVGMFLLLTAGRNKWQRGIGVWFIAMMIAHISYWISEPKTYQISYVYWIMFTFLGWGQLFHVGIWHYKTSGYNSFGDLLHGVNFSSGKKL